MATDDVDTVSLRWILGVIARWAWLIVGCAVLAGAIALLVTSRRPPTYRAGVTLLVAVRDNPAAGGVTNLLVGQQLALTYSEMLKGRSVLPTVIAELGLHESPEALAKSVSAAAIKDTPLIHLTVTDQSPTRAAQVANAIADEFVAYVRSLAGGRSTGSTSSTLVVLEPASAPLSPAVDPLLYVFLAAAIGAVGGATLSFIIESLDDTIKSPEEASDSVGLETIGQIGKRGKEHELVVVSEPQSPAAETIGMLAANIRFCMVDRALRTLLVTSPVPQEGKSFVTANLAAALAIGGLRVVVVDADQRHPRLHRILGLEQGYGVAECLQDDEGVPGLRPSEIEHMRVLTSGTPPTEPAALLSTPRMVRLLSTLKQEADLVVVDCPPVLPVADAAILSSLVDGVLLVLRADRSRRHEAVRAVQALRHVRAPLIGVVLNAVRSSPGSRYAYYYTGTKATKHHGHRHRAGALQRQHEETRV